MEKRERRDLLLILKLCINAFGVVCDRQRKVSPVHDQNSIRYLSKEGMKINQTACISW